MEVAVAAPLAPLQRVAAMETVMVIDVMIQAVQLTSRLSLDPSLAGAASSSAAICSLSIAWIAGRRRSRRHGRRIRIIRSIIRFQIAMCRANLLSSINRLIMNMDPIEEIRAH